MVPIFIAGFAFFVVRPTFAQIVEGETNLAQYLGENNVEVGQEAKEGGPFQIYYFFQGEKTFVTDSVYTNEAPDADGEYITWMSQIGGSWQIFLYHIPTDSTIQLSASSNNANPKVSGGKVVWEGWVNDPPAGGWQVFLFDGKSIRQLTTGDISMNPEIEGDNIVYGRKDVTGTWRAVVYSISKNESKEVATGIASKKPKLRNGRVILAGIGVEEQLPLTEDLLVPFSATPTPTTTVSIPESVSFEEVAQELETTPSAQIEPEASPSPTPTLTPVTPTPIPSPTLTPEPSEEASPSATSL